MLFVVVVWVIVMDVVDLFVVDMNGFWFGSVDDLCLLNFLLGGVKYGDLLGMLVVVVLY